MTATDSGPTIASLSRRRHSNQIQLRGRMRLPFADQAIVPESKLTGYLLSASHPEGRHKARFFRSVGFNLDDSDLLRAGLLRLAQSTEMEESLFPYGAKYVGVGGLTSPSGVTIPLLTVWILRDNMPPPLFVTAYPGWRSSHERR